MEDIYGFEDKHPKPVEKPDPSDELPIQHFSLNRMLDELARLQVGGFRVTRPFEDEVRWGESDGAIRARLTPNQGVSIERLTSDLEGKPFWITKKLVKMKTNQFAGHEDVVSGEIEEHILSLAREPIDGAVRGYKDIWTLTKRVAEGVKGVNPSFVYQEIKKVSETNYNILFSVANGGVGQIVRNTKGGSTPAGIIDMSYNPERGSIKGILTTIEIEGESSSWVIGIPYFMGEFSPTQPIDEIVRALQAGLKFI